jgi:peptidoglycan/xylan/chitin deacetylase (PgdA/CDA1 family)
MDELMRAFALFCAASWMLGWAAAATAAECPGNPDALGTERVIAVDPTEHPRIGTMQYPESLPLADKEVVLTFDDGPVPVYTNRILETLAAECVKATFFIVGRQAHAFPAEVRKVYNDGHTIATHSQNHPLIFTRLSIARAKEEIDQGIASVTAALGDPNALAPFFRFPGLGRSRAIEAYLAARGIMTWSADFPADDWTHISGDEVYKRALERIEHRGRGVLLLHDIQPATALMLPHLLRTLKERGYHIVQVVPAGPERPRTLTEPEAWVLHKSKPTVWPLVLEKAVLAMPSPSLQSFGWPEPFHSQIVAPPMPFPPHLAHGLFAKLVEALTGPETPVAETRRPEPVAAGSSLEPAAPVDTFALAGEAGPVAQAALVAPEATLAAMIAPPPQAAAAMPSAAPAPTAPALAPKPRPAVIRVRRPAAVNTPAAAPAPPTTSTRAPRASIQTAPLRPPHLVAGEPAQPMLLQP